MTLAPCRGDKWTVCHDALQHVEGVDMMCCHPPEMMDVTHMHTPPACNCGIVQGYFASLRCYAHRGTGVLGQHGTYSCAKDPWHLLMDPANASAPAVNLPSPLLNWLPTALAGLPKS